jgi:hypothetical protein
MIEENRSRFIRIAAWLLLGLVVGVGIGLLVGWVAWPIQFSEADPSVMEERFQQDYTLMIAAAYSEEEDLSTARRRLRSLDQDDSGRWVLGVTVSHILSGEDEPAIQHLVKLADDLGLYSPVMEPYLIQLELEQNQ